MELKKKCRTEIEKIISSKDIFHSFVYTPLEEAIIELAKRKEEPVDEENFKDLPQQMVALLKKNTCVLFHRPLVTPNYEVMRFVNIADAMDCTPLFFEYHNDKFVTRNTWKYYLGRLGLNCGLGKKGGQKIEYVNAIDLVGSDGKKIQDVKTLWGQELIDFHHQLFFKKYPNLRENVFDGTEWYAKNGKSPSLYYKPFLKFLINNCIFFENFLLDEEELEFTSKIILPTLIELRNEGYKKPLIVALEPTEIEGDIFWMCHPQDVGSSLVNI